MCDANHNIIRTFESIVEINKFLKVVDSHHGISNAIKNGTKYHSYFWEYKSEFAVNA